MIMGAQETEAISILMSLCKLPPNSQPPSPDRNAAAVELPRKRSSGSLPPSPSSHDSVYLKPRRMSLSSDNGPGWSSRRASVASDSDTLTNDSNPSGDSSSSDSDDSTMSDEETPSSRDFVERKQQPPVLRRSSVPGRATLADQPSTATAALPRPSSHTSLATASTSAAAHPFHPPTGGLMRVDHATIVLPPPIATPTSLVSVIEARRPPAAHTMSTQARYSQSIGCRHVVIAYSIFQSQNLARNQAAANAAHANLQASSLPFPPADPLAAASRFRQRMQTKEPPLLAPPPVLQSTTLHLSPVEQLHLLQQLQACNSGLQSALHFGAYAPSAPSRQVATAAASITVRPMVQLARVIPAPIRHNASRVHPRTAHPGLQRRHSTPIVASSATVAASAMDAAHHARPRLVHRPKSLYSAHAPLPPQHPHLPQQQHSVTFVQSLPSSIRLAIHSAAPTSSQPIIRVPAPTAPLQPPLATFATLAAAASPSQPHPSTALQSVAT